MGSSMTKSRRCEYNERWQRFSKGDVGSHFSKEYAQYWRRSTYETGAKFSIDKNEYNYATQDVWSPANSGKRYPTFESAFR